jgi:hypothetical protein
LCCSSEAISKENNTGGFGMVQIYLLVFVMLYLNRRATKILRTAGYNVGFWGANMKQFLEQKSSDLI